MATALPQATALPLPPLAELLLPRPHSERRAVAVSAELVWEHAWGAASLQGPRYQLCLSSSSFVGCMSAP